MDLLELPPTTSGYQIREAKLPITISLLPLTSLRAHEEVVEEELTSLSKSIHADKVLRHPIIADARTGIVLDGTHRLLALRNLSCQSAPVALVDYNSPAITIERWYRIIEGTTMDDVLGNIGSLDFLTKEMDPEKASRMLEDKRVVAVLQDGRHAVTLAARVPAQGTLEIVRAGFQVERAVRDAGRLVRYVDSKPRPAKEATVILSMLKLQKQDVVDTAMAGRLYPPKSTRHHVPSRPLSTKVPLEWLAMQDLKEAQAKLMRHLGGMKLTRLAEGSIVGSRRYSEEVFLFG